MVNVTCPAIIRARPYQTVEKQAIFIHSGSGCQQRQKKDLSVSCGSWATCQGGTRSTRGPVLNVFSPGVRAEPNLATGVCSAGCECVPAATMMKVGQHPHCLHVQPPATHPGRPAVKCAGTLSKTWALLAVRHACKFYWVMCRTTGG